MGNAIKLSKVLLAVLLAAALFIQSANMRPVYADECYTCESDFDNDGVVDGSDLANLADEFGETNCCTGISADAIYVSISHPAAADTEEAGLTPSLPALSISYGILRAVQTGRAEVRVAGGLYEESVTFQNGISMLGGYDPATWQRDWAAYPTIIKGSSASGHRSAITADCMGSGAPAVLEGFVVFGENAGGSGENSYGIYIKDCTGNLVVRYNVIQAGAGGDGARGDNGTSGSDGAMGGAGTNALDLFAAYGVTEHNCTSANHSAGGSGGISTCGGVPTSGGDGGNCVCPDYDGEETLPPVASETGQDGLNGGGSGGSAGRDVYHQAFSCEGYNSYGSILGEDGQNGSDGTNGAAGPSCADPDGFIPVDDWAAGIALSGGDGTAGGGGGGGGSGAGAYVHTSCYARDYGYDNLGGTGGGGGSGGCGASAGTFGFGGGGSFGMFVVFTSSPGSVPDIRDNVIHTSDGGKGGDGGNGGVGGTGGAGGSGGAGSTDPYTVPVDPVYPSLPGGNGGNGGNGGHGGGGGGGCGGVSYGIYAHGQGGLSLSSWASLNTFHLEGAGGSRGYGGVSFGNPGGNGQTGAAAATNF